MARTVYFKDFLKEAIRHRFAEVSLLGADNDIIHNITEYQSNNPEWIKNILNEKGIIFNPNLTYYNAGIQDVTGQYPENIVTHPDYILAPGFKKYMELAGIPKRYFKELPFASKSLKKEFGKIPEKKLDIVFIGYGGAVSNILGNLSLLSETFNINPIFNSVSIFEKENWAFTNTLRLGKQVLHKSFSKFVVDDDESTAKKLLTVDNEIKLASTFEMYYKYLEEEDVKEILEKNPDTLFIGAPNLETRRMLKRLGAHFIMVGHSGNSIRITKNPNVHEGVVETYGTIDVPVLLLNLWVATYKLIDLINSGDLFGPEGEKFEFNFDEYLNENPKALKKLQKGFKFEENEGAENDQ